MNKTSSFLSIIGLLLVGSSLAANPTGGEIIHGDISISPNATSLMIQQSSEKAIINWSDFSIKEGEVTKFILPSNKSSVLNKVTGDLRSDILGSLQANGKVYLVNPNGVFIGPKGEIKAHTFLGTTLDIKSEEFLKDEKLSLSGSSDAKILNEGSVKASKGNIILVARGVENKGSLEAPDGNISLIGGREILLAEEDNPNVGVVIDPNTVKNSGSIEAVQIKLQSYEGNIFSLAVNQDGIVEGTAIQEVDGKLALIPASITEVGGEIIALDQATEIGGQIHVLGDEISVLENTHINASGNFGGGEILIGGDTKGSNPSIPNAKTLTVAEGSLIEANSMVSGDAGKVILYSKENTKHFGHIDARAFGNSGNGGFSEVSALSVELDDHPDMRSESGQAGTFMIDPYRINIVNGPNIPPSGDTWNSGYIEAQLAVGNFFLQADHEMVINNLWLTWDNNLLTLRSNGYIQAMGRLEARENGFIELYLSEILFSGFDIYTNAGDINFNYYGWNSGIFRNSNFSSNSGNINIQSSSPLKLTESSFYSTHGNVSYRNLYGNAPLILENSQIGSSSGNVLIAANEINLLSPFGWYNSRISTGSGNLEIQCEVFQGIPTSFGEVRSVTGNIIISANLIENLPEINTSGSCNIQPLHPGRNMNIAASTAGEFTLTATDLNNLGNDIAHITFGSAYTGGTTTTGGYSFSSPVTIYGNNLEIQSSQTLSGTDITLISNTINLAGSLNSSGSLSLLPMNGSTTMGMGSGTGSYHLSIDEIGRITGSPNSVTIGNTNASNLNLGSDSNETFSFNLNVILQAGTINFGSTDNLDLNTHNLTLGCNHQNFFGSIINPGNILTLQTLSTNSSIGIDHDTSDLRFSNAQLSNLFSGFSEGIIGRSDASNTINIGNDNATTINIDLPITFKARNVNLQDPVSSSHRIDLFIGVSGNGQATINKQVACPSFHITGGDNDDTVTMADLITVSGIVDGDGGTNSLDYTSWSPKPTYDLAAERASNIYGGASGGVVNFQRVVTEAPLPPPIDPTDPSAPSLPSLPSLPSTPDSPFTPQEKRTISTNTQISADYNKVMNFVDHRGFTPRFSQTINPSFQGGWQNINNPQVDLFE